MIHARDTRRFWPVFAALSVLVLASGCSSTVKRYDSGRVGLFDQWAKYEAVNPGGVVREDDASGAVAANDEGETELSAEKLDELKRFASRWQWPLKDVRVTSEFGERGKNFHEGLDLKAPVGTPVYATDAGVVAYSGRKIRGYGKMIVVKHGGSLATVYAHNSTLYVKKGQRIRKGQKIALSGQTGRATGPHLHFEIRHGALALNPAVILPVADAKPKAARDVASK